MANNNNSELTPEEKEEVETNGYNFTLPPDKFDAAMRQVEDDSGA